MVDLHKTLPWSGRTHLYTGSILNTLDSGVATGGEDDPSIGIVIGFIVVIYAVAGSTVTI